MSQSANRALGQRGISGQDYHRLAGEGGPDDGRGGAAGGALELEDQSNQRTDSIESIEKTLYDVLNLFKRFGTIV